jgi:hypothetical protein
MRLKTTFLILALACLNQTANAYVPSMGGSGGGGGSCAKPNFSRFLPEANSEVKAGSEFSFVASANTHPKTIKVTVKDQPVELTIPENTESTYIVKGKLPASLKNTFARITINAQTSSQCKGSEGWLIKIAE